MKRNELIQYNNDKESAKKDQEFTKAQEASYDKSMSDMKQTEAKPDKKRMKEKQKELQEAGVLEKEGAFLGVGGHDMISSDALEKMSMNDLKDVYAIAEMDNNEDLMKQVNEAANDRISKQSAKQDPMEELYQQNRDEQDLRERLQDKGYSDEEISDRERRLERGEMDNKVYDPMKRNELIRYSNDKVSAEEEQEFTKAQEAAYDKSMSGMKQAEVVSEFKDKYGTPSTLISVPEKSAVMRSEEMMMSQTQLDNTKTKQSGGSSTNVTAASTSVNTSNVTNNSYTSMPMPSSQDNSDQLYIFRATGTSR